MTLLKILPKGLSTDIMEEKKVQTPYLEQLTSEQDLKQAIEAILYAAGYPMRYDKLG